MRMVTSDEIDRLLTFDDLIGDLRAVFSKGGESPERHHHAIGSHGPIHLIMPAWTADAPGADSFIGTKIVNFFPGNGARGLPAILGTYLLQSGETGQPLAVMDGTRLTHWRTAAASGLAASFLARADARHLVMVGSGALAPFLVRAHAAVRPLDRVTVWNRNRAGAERLAAALADPGWSVDVADDLRAAVETADIISCATNATAPLVKGAWLRPGAHLDLVGAFAMSMREVDDAALRGSRVFIDTAMALTEGGDVAIGLRDGVIAPVDVIATLFDLCQGKAAGRASPQEITLFKSVGTGIEDLAAAMRVWRKLAASSMSGS